MISMPGDPLPDTLTWLLSGSPFVYIRWLSRPAISSTENTLDRPRSIAMRVLFYAQDSWKLNSRFLLDYGVRWEIYTPITERAKRTAGFLNIGNVQEYVVNLQPEYKLNLNGWDLGHS
jgi:outer membrane receptor protein involved in Fe transport